MPAANNIVTMKGLPELIAKTRKFKQSIQDDVDAELNASALEIEANAKRLAPADFGAGGGLRGRFYVKTGVKLSKVVGNSSEYAAYQEFGTGVHAASYVKQLPKDWQAYAMTFFINGEGRVPAHPFLFPAYEQERPLLIKRVKKILGWRRFFK